MTSLKKCDFVEIILSVWSGANFAEDVESCHYFSWRAQCFVRVGGVEVEFSCQAQGVVRLRLGGGERRCAIGARLWF